MELRRQLTRACSRGLRAGARAGYGLVAREAELDFNIILVFFFGRSLYRYPGCGRGASCISALCSELSMSGGSAAMPAYHLRSGPQNARWRAAIAAASSVAFPLALPLGEPLISLRGGGSSRRPAQDPLESLEEVPPAASH